MSIMLEGLAITVVGVLTVFTVLLLIAISIMIFSCFFVTKKPAEVKADVVTQPSTNAPAVSVAPVQNVQNDEEIVAAITVAIANSLNVPTDSLIVKSIRKRA